MSGEAAELVPKIQLTPEESEVFDLLKRTGDSIGATVRVAGGWVRDKLLGKPSDDVDIALDTCTGIVFANAVNEFIAEQGGPLSKVTVIKANPDQSKHLETATCKIHNIELDFVNLRTEKYGDSNGRIPRVFNGTAEEDAFRRDITINSLFYNITTSRVEDLTGRGIRDLLVDRIIRTPLDPVVTFMDDPLRVLRAVRFAAVLDGFELAPDLCAAARTEGVQQNLRRKVRRERIGKEIRKLLGGCRPLHGLRLLHSLKLLPVVFQLPPPQLRIDELDEDGLWKESLRRLDLLETIVGSGRRGSEPWVKAEQLFTKKLQEKARVVQAAKWRAQLEADWEGPDAATRKAASDPNAFVGGFNPAAIAVAKCTKLRKRHPTKEALRTWLDEKTANWSPPLLVAGGAIATDVEDLGFGEPDPSYRLLLLAVLLSPLYFAVKPNDVLPPIAAGKVKLESLPSKRRQLPVPKHMPATGPGTHDPPKSCRCDHVKGHTVLAGLRCWRSGKKKKPASVFNYILSQSLKESSKVIAAVTGVVESSFALHNVLECCFPEPVSHHSSSASDKSPEWESMVDDERGLSTKQRLFLGWWVSSAGPVWPLAWTVGAVSCLSRVRQQRWRDRKCGSLAESASPPAIGSEVLGTNIGSPRSNELMSSPRGGARVAAALEQQGLHGSVMLVVSQCSCVFWHAK